MLAILLASAASVGAQNQYIGFVYPAGGQQGSTFPVRLGGQGLNYASDLVVSGEGVSARLVDYYLASLKYNLLQFEFHLVSKLLPKAPFLLLEHHIL